MAENGRNANLAWIAHTTMEKANLANGQRLPKPNFETLHCKSKRSLSFARCTEIMMKCFNTLHKDPDQR
jgi:hypothetical protein